MIPAWILNNQQEMKTHRLAMLPAHFAHFVLYTFPSACTVLTDEQYGEWWLSLPMYDRACYLPCLFDQTPDIYTDAILLYAEN